MICRDETDVSILLHIWAMNNADYDAVVLLVEKIAIDYLSDIIYNK